MLDWLVTTITGLEVVRAAETSASQIFTIPSGNITTFPLLANRILDLLTAIAYPLAFLSLVYSAYLLITAGGKPEAWTTTKKNLLNLCIGVFLISFASIFVRLVVNLFK